MNARGRAGTVVGFFVSFWSIPINLLLFSTWIAIADDSKVLATTVFVTGTLILIFMSGIFGSMICEKYLEMHGDEDDN